MLRWWAVGALSPAQVAFLEPNPYDKVSWDIVVSCSVQANNATTQLSGEYSGACRPTEVAVLGVALLCCMYVCISNMIEVFMIRAWLFWLN